jgi:hypothetical protein
MVSRLQTKTFLSPMKIGKKIRGASTSTIKSGLAKILITASITLFSSQATAELITILSSQSIEELESVRLAIRDVGTRQSESLDLTALNTDFHIMGTNTSSQYQYINGRAESWIDYQITLQPKRTGTLSIPPIKVGNETTKSLTLTVEKLTDTARAKIDAQIFFEQSFSEKEIYVQSQLLMTRRLFYIDGVQLYGGLPDAPKINDALVITLGENKNTTALKNGESYGLIEQRYAIFPQSSGTLIIPPNQISASVRLVDRGRATRRAVRVGTKSEEVQILPIPPEYPKDQPWLPALDLTLDQNFTIADEQTVQVGENFERTIALAVYGNTGAIAPPMLGELDAKLFKQYPSQAAIEDNTNGTTVVGLRRESTDIVGLKPGAHMIEGIDVYWWDTQSKVVRSTSIDDVVLTAIGESLSIVEAGQQPGKSTAHVIESKTTVMQRSLDYRGNFAQLLLGILLAVLLWRAIYRPREGKKTIARPEQLQKHKRAYLKTAKGEDLNAIRETLKTYLALQFNTTEGRAWHLFMQSSNHARAYLEVLDATRYGPGQETLISPEQLAELGKSALEQLNVRRASEINYLPELYPGLDSANS